MPRSRRASRTSGGTRRSSSPATVGNTPPSSRNSTTSRRSSSAPRRRRPVSGCRRERHRPDHRQLHRPALPSTPSRSTGLADDERVDISQLTSAHRIVFRSNGGNDTIVGTLREQDVIELEPGRTADEYEWEENEDGTTSVTCGGHRVTFRCEEVAGRTSARFRFRPIPRFLSIRETARRSRRSRAPTSLSSRRIRSA